MRFPRIGQGSWARREILCRETTATGTLLKQIGIELSENEVAEEESTMGLLLAI
jgi:hypothetical protein